MGLANLPPDYEIVEGVVTDRGLRLTVRSDALPVMHHGERVPEEMALFEQLEMSVRGHRF